MMIPLPWPGLPSSPQQRFWSLLGMAALMIGFLLAALRNIKSNNAAKKKR